MTCVRPARPDFLNPTTRVVPGGVCRVRFFPTRPPPERPRQVHPPDQGRPLPGEALRPRLPLQPRQLPHQARRPQGHRAVLEGRDPGPPQVRPAAAPYGRRRPGLDRRRAGPRRPRPGGRAGVARPPPPGTPRSRRPGRTPARVAPPEARECAGPRDVRHGRGGPQGRGRLARAGGRLVGGLPDGRRAGLPRVQPAQGGPDAASPVPTSVFGSGPWEFPRTSRPRGDASPRATLRV
jgi:hypothetical protein